VTLWGDVREGIRDLAAALSGDAKRLAAERAEYVASIGKRMATWKTGVMARLTSNESPINVARMMHELNGLMPEDGILVADGGFAAHWAGLLYDTKRPGRGFVPDRGFASIGYGLPGAMGAALAANGRPVLSLTGDGGFNMSLGDLETARRMGLGFAIVVFNNGASGYVKALQHLMYGAGAYQSSDLAETNYAKVAEAMGCTGIRVEKPDELAGAFRNGLAAKGGPVVIDVVVTRDPARMLPAVDNRAVEAKKGDRVA
jgi:acetolactate synthase I/II/III large subunit